MANGDVGHDRRVSSHSVDRKYLYASCVCVRGRTMVMELSTQCVGREFVKQYYTMLNQAPNFLHRSVALALEHIPFWHQNVASKLVILTFVLLCPRLFIDSVMSGHSGLL